MPHPHPSPPWCQHKEQEAAIAQQICLSLFWLVQGRKSLRSQLAQLERKSQHPPLPSCLVQTLMPAPKPNKLCCIKLRCFTRLQLLWIPTLSTQG